MPMLVGPERLLEAGALLRLLAELGQPAGVMEHAPHAGWTDRHHAGIDHHVRQPPVALQRVFGMKIENGLLFPILQPKVTGNPAVVLVRFSVALAPVVKLSSHDAELLMNHPMEISALSDHCSTKSTIWSRLSGSTQIPIRAPQVFFLTRCAPPSARPGPRPSAESSFPVSRCARVHQ